MKAMKLLAVLALTVVTVAAIAGCISWFDGATLTANPQKGIPLLRDGGLEVAFASNGIISSIDYGDGTSGADIVHVYAKVGTYRAIATIMHNGNLKYEFITITVQNDHPEVYPPFFAGSYPQLGGRSILDGRKQQHGCTGGGDLPWQIDESGNPYSPFPGTAMNYGAWPRPGEVFVYSWKITIRYPGSNDELIVYADGTDEYPLDLIGWHVGEEIRIFPDLLPVPEITGVWIPPTMAAMSVCIEDEDTNCALEKDPWEGYPENTAGSAVAVAVVEMTVTNQLGCYTTTFNTVNVYAGRRCP